MINNKRTSFYVKNEYIDVVEKFKLIHNKKRFSDAVCKLIKESIKNANNEVE